MTKVRAIKKMLGILAKLGIILLTLAVLLSATVVIINAAMIHAGSMRLREVSELNGNGVDCVLVLGAGLKADGTPSHMLEDRIKVGVEALNATGADYILMSGDHSDVYYNEPLAMKKYAMEMGVPEEKILMDGKGYSTNESLTRADKIYNFDNIVVITQEYHLYRALYIADMCDIEAVGVSADLRPYRNQIMREVREILARVKDFFLCN